MRKIVLPLLTILAAGCVPAHRDTFAGLGATGADPSLNAIKGLTVAEVESENTRKVRTWVAGMKLITFGTAPIIIPSRVDKLLRERFKEVIVSEKLSDPAVSQADVIAVLDMTIDGTPFGVPHAKTQVKVIFLSPEQKEILSLEGDGSSRSIAGGLLGAGGLLPTQIASADAVFHSAQNQAWEKIERAFGETGVPKLAHYAAERKAAASPGAAAEASKVINSDVDKPSYKVDPDPHKFAVVVGVENYKSLPRAEYAEHDAAAVYSHLLSLGYPADNIKYIVGLDATQSALQKNLEKWLPRVAREDSQVFFYFSGHGAPKPETGQAFLVPWDGDTQYLEETAYPVKKLYDELGALRAKSVVIALDSCFSGTGGRSVLPKGARPLVLKVDISSLGQSRSNMVALTASGGNQISGALDNQGHGLFTYYFLKGLNGDAASKGGKITVEGLYNYVRPLVREMANRDNRDQTPQLMQGASTKLDDVALR